MLSTTKARSRCSSPSRAKLVPGLMDGRLGCSCTRWACLPARMGDRVLTWCCKQARVRAMKMAGLLVLVCFSVAGSWQFWPASQSPSQSAVSTPFCSLSPVLPRTRTSPGSGGPSALGCGRSGGRCCLPRACGTPQSGLCRQACQQSGALHASMQADSLHSWLGLPWYMECSFNDTCSSHDKT